MKLINRPVQIGQYHRNAHRAGNILVQLQTKLSKKEIEETFNVKCDSFKRWLTVKVPLDRVDQIFEVGKKHGIEV